MNKNKVKPLACPNCGDANIGVKDSIVSTPWKREARKVWAYCRSCGLKSPETVCDIDIDDQGEINEAYTVWNQAQQKNANLKAERKNGTQCF